MIGLGRMGANMAQRLVRGGHRVVGFDPAVAARRAIEEKGAESVASLEELIARLRPPRILWLMVPAGAITDNTITALTPLLSAGDTIMDGGNSNYHDTQRRAQALGSRQIHFVDSGTSGGVWGLAEGYSLMIGGDEAVVERLRPIFETLAPAPDKGWGRVGRGRLRPLHQDDPQRHRVWLDAGLCRRLVDSAAQERIRARSAADRRDLALRQRGALVASGPDRRCARQEPDAARDRALRGRFGRGALDRGGGHRTRRARARSSPPR